MDTDHSVRGGRVLNLRAGGWRSSEQKRDGKSQSDKEHLADYFCVSCANNFGNQDANTIVQQMTESGEKLTFNHLLTAKKER